MDGFTPLLVASQQGHLWTTQILTEAGANLSAITFEGANILFWPSYFGHMHILDYLRPKSLYLNHQDDRGRTALWAAALGNRSMVIEALGELGANVSISDNNAWQPIHIAAHLGHLQVQM